MLAAASVLRPPSILGTAEWMRDLTDDDDDGERRPPVRQPKRGRRHHISSDEEEEEAIEESRVSIDLSSSPEVPVRSGV